MVGRHENTVLRAITGLEGGAVASGSTCGVVTGGALGIALMNEELLAGNGVAAEESLLKQVGEYVDWFSDAFGTTLCSELTRVNFHHPLGQIRYLLPGDRFARCLWHINKAVQHIHAYQDGKKIIADRTSLKVDDEAIHCAGAVLRGIREKTGVGDDLLERLSVVFDGGVGLKGGLCGALAGAVLALNLSTGWDIRSMSLVKTIKGFIIGHLNLLIDNPVGKAETFAMGKVLVSRFASQSGALECKEILKREFASRDDFQKHICTSQTCRGLISLVVDAASTIIENIRP